MPNINTRVTISGMAEPTPKTAKTMNISDVNESEIRRPINPAIIAISAKTEKIHRSSLLISKIFSL